MSDVMGEATRMGMWEEAMVPPTNGAQWRAMETAMLDAFAAMLAAGAALVAAFSPVVEQLLRDARIAAAVLDASIALNMREIRAMVAEYRRAEWIAAQQWHLQSWQALTPRQRKDRLRRLRKGMAA